MTSVLLAPHNDDEALFAAFQILEHRPLVIVVLRSHAQGNNWMQRQGESWKAVEHLGGTFEQWPFPDNAPDWDEIERRVRDLTHDHDHVIAPHPRWTLNDHRPGAGELALGVRQHDHIGQMALDAFGDLRTTGYLTYTRAGGKDTDGERVEPASGMVGMKLQALAMYESQLNRADTRPHFLGPLDEYVAR